MGAVKLVLRTVVSVQPHACMYSIAKLSTATAHLKYLELDTAVSAYVREG